MNDIVSKIMIILIGSIFLFIVPATNIALKQDNTSQTIIDNAVVEFVDNARTAGMITAEGYEKMCANIDKTQAVCEIKIIHSSKYVVPIKELDEEGYYDFKSYREDYNKDYILKYIYESETDNLDYKMKQGDYLKVVVYNTKPTLGIKMFNMFTTNKSEMSLYTSYGGYVGNIKQ